MRATFACCLAVVGISSLASAQEVTAPPPSETEPAADYRAAIDEALSESSGGHWAEARALFRHAQELWPNARALRGIGMASFELRDYTDAYRALGAALVETTHQSLTDTQRVQVEELHTRARAFVAVYTPPTLPATATLATDGSPAQLEPDGTLLLAIGEHRVAVHLGTQTTERRIEVRGGESGELAIDLSALTTPQSSGGTPTTTTRPSPAPLGAWALAIGGGVATVAGIVLVAAGVADLDTVNGAPPGTDWTALDGAASRAPVLTGIGVPLLCVGLAAAAVGVVWIVVGGGAHSERAVSLGVRLGGLELRGTW